MGFADDATSLVDRLFGDEPLQSPFEDEPEWTSAQFPAGDVRMELSAAVQTVPGTPVDRDATVQPSERASMIVRVRNVGEVNSPPVEIRVVLPDGVDVVPRTTRFHFAGRNDDLQERDIDATEDGSWTGLGKYGPGSHGYVTFDVKVLDEFDCGETAETIVVYARTSVSEVEVRSEVTFTVVRRC